MKNRFLAILLTVVIAIPCIAGAGDDKTKTPTTDQTMTQNGDATHDVAKSTEVISDFARMKELMREPVIFDGRNILDPPQIRGLGFTYWSVGRP